MTSGGGGRAPYFRRYGRELVSKPAISLKECWRGYRRNTRIDSCLRGMCVVEVAIVPAFRF